MDPAPAHGVPICPIDLSPRLSTIESPTMITPWTPLKSALVFDHPWFQVTGKDGKFRLKNIPAGKYQLKLNHPAGNLRWTKEIEVKAGLTTRIDIRLSPDDRPKKRKKPQRGAKS